MHRWPSVFVDRIPQKPISGHLSARGVVMQIADDLSAQRPKIVHVLANCFGRETRGHQVLNERSETNYKSLSGR